MARAARLFRLKDLFRHQTLSGLTVRADGGAVAWTAAQPNLNANENYSAVWAWTPEGGASPVTFSGKAAAPQFAPRGRRLAYLSDRGQKSQVVVMADGLCEGRPVTRFEEGVVSFTWSPDGRRLAVIAVADRTAEEKQRDQAKRDWRTVDADERRRQLWIVRADGKGTPLRLSLPGEHVSSVAWTLDGKRLAYVACPVASINSQWFESHLMIVSDGGRNRRRLCPMRGPTVEGRMSVSADGRTLLACGPYSEADQWHSVAVLIDLATGRRKLVAPDFDVRQMNPQWLPDGRVLFEGDVGTSFRIGMADACGNVRLLPTGPGAAGFAAPTPQGDAVFFVYSEPERPDEVYRMALDGTGTMEQLTHLNQPMAAVRLSRAEVVTWQGKGGLTIEGLLYLPTGAARKPYPLIVMPHGGPYGSSVASYTGSAVPNIFTAAGYACLLPNFRGSTGRGRLFTRKIVRDWGDGPFTDIMTGVEALVRRKVADPRRLAIFGGSYGGYMTAWAVGHTRRFRCAVAMAPVINNLSQYGTCDIPDFMLYSGGDRAVSFTDKFWYEQSPLHYADRVRTPTLIITGEIDARVPPGQSFEFYRALKARGVETRLVLFPREPHGVNEPQHRLHYFQMILEWINEHCR